MASNSDLIRFDGKVVIVTGAGGGLGKCYAIEFAKRGAKVVVNDLGGTMTGDGKGETKAADLVVNEIKTKFNGIAVANYDSVEEGEKIVKTALDNFGRIDILINNAGILRDKSFIRTSDLDWDLIHRVHLRGSFLLSRAAWPHMQKNKFGRIIMTSSGAGIYGNFGQANYSAAKLGLLGLSNTLSIEGKKYNITCNTIAPVARSRLTQTVMPEDILNILKPEYVAPLVVYLCHQECDESGSLFEVGGGWIGKLRWQKSTGAVVTKKSPTEPSDLIMTPEDVRLKWNEITSFDTPIYHTSIGDSTNHCINAASGSLDSPTTEIKSNSLLIIANDENKYRYDYKDIILYNLSLGISTANEANLKFLYENHSDFCVMPSFGVIPAFQILTNFIGQQAASNQIPHNIQIDPAKLLHGEHYLEIFKTFKCPSGVLVLKPKIVDVLDKGSGACLIINVDLIDETTNDLMARNQFVTFLVGSGNFGGKRDSDNLIKLATNSITKDEKPHDTLEEKTTIDQAALYRLNGDFNPLHIDPSFSAVLGFDKPILHGLCSFGFAVKHILQTYCDNDVSLFKSIKVRFVKPVLPGQTIQTNMWLSEKTPQTPEYTVYFECKVIETQTVVIGSGAYVKLHNIASKSKQNQKTPQSSSVIEKTETKNSFASEKIFAEIEIRMKKNPDIGKSINKNYAFRIKKNDEIKLFVVDLKQNLIKSTADKTDVELKSIADCIITCKDEDFISLASGTGNPQQMFMKGQLKIKGNIMLAQKLEKLFKQNSKI